MQDYHPVVQEPKVGKFVGLLYRPKLFWMSVGLTIAASSMFIGNAFLLKSVINNMSFAYLNSTGGSIIGGPMTLVKSLLSVGIYGAARLSIKVLQSKQSDFITSMVQNGLMEMQVAFC